MSAGAWLMLAAVCLTGAISPGPSLLVVVRTTLRSGARVGAVLACSHALAIGVYAGLVVFGLTYLVTESPQLLQALRLAGAGFLLYLAWSAWSGSALPLLDDNMASSEHLRLNYRQAARDGFLTGLLNPKILFWFVALFSQFVEPATQLWEKVGIAWLAVGIDAAWYLLVVAVLQRAAQRRGFARWVERNGTNINRCFAVLLVLIAVRVLL